MADSAKHPRLQMSRHLSGLASPKVATGGQAKGGQMNGNGNDRSSGRAPKGAQANVGACSLVTDNVTMQHSVLLSGTQIVNLSLRLLLFPLTGSHRCLGG
jgi:hypothetical protein